MPFAKGSLPAAAVVAGDPPLVLYELLLSPSARKRFGFLAS